MYDMYIYMYDISQYNNYTNIPVSPITYTNILEEFPISIPLYQHHNIDVIFPLVG